MRLPGCICNFNPETTDGPDEDCPHHGRWPEVAVRHHTHEWTVVTIGNVPVGAACECGEDTGFEKPPLDLQQGGAVTITDPFGQTLRMVVQDVSLRRNSDGASASIELTEPSRYLMVDNDKFTQPRYTPRPNRWMAAPQREFTLDGSVVNIEDTPPW